MEPIYDDDVELNKILIPHIMLAQQKNNIYLSHTIKYMNQGEFPPLITSK